MGSPRIESYFSNVRNSGGVVVEGIPKLDLETYISNYKGRTRFDRLFLIGNSSPALCQEALKAARDEAKRGKDVARYERAARAYYELNPEDPDSALDTRWVSDTQKQVTSTTSKLEAELKGYRNNLIKESIRMGYDDLGQHHHLIGDLSAAITAYAKMREFSTSHSHIVLIALRLIHASIEQSHWHAVESNVSRITPRNENKSLKSKDQSENATHEPYAAKLSAAMGLARMHTLNYRLAAQEFLSTPLTFASAKLDPSTPSIGASADEETFHEVLTPNDIAIYGSLCALASMSREELQKHVLSNTSFRNFLELEPHVRRAVAAFVASKFEQCLEILEDYRVDWMLDIHLQPHLPTIYQRVRSKAIYQYFIPFSRASFSSLSSAFRTPEEDLAKELERLIKSGELPRARLDLADRCLVADQVDEKEKLYDDALEMARKYERTLYLRMLRMELVNKGIEVGKDKGKGGGPSMSGGVGGGGGRRDGLGGEGWPGLGGMGDPSEHLMLPQMGGGRENLGI